MIRPVHAKLMAGVFLSVKANTEAAKYDRLSDEEVIAQLSCVHFQRCTS
jgi:hypothetical protein